MATLTLAAPRRLNLRLASSSRLPLSHTRNVLRAGYATASPSAKDTADKLTTDLWKNYNVNLRHAFLQNSGKFDSKKQAFFTAPIGVMGIPAGGNITAPYTNFGIYNVADSLLDVNNPVFTAGTGSYIDRQMRYLNAIQLPKNTNTGAELRLQTARAKQDEVQEAMDALSAKAKEAYGEENKLPFSAWVSKNYPKYDSLKSELQQAAASTGAAMIEVYGPGAKELNRRITMLDKARDDEAHPGLNMPVLTDQVSIASAAKAKAEGVVEYPEYRPAYTISGGYTDAVKQWVANNASNSASAKPTIIDLSSSKYSNETWEHSGFSQTSASVSGAWSFISASVSGSTSSSEQHLNAEQLGAGMSVKLITSGIKSFEVKPGQWDGDFTKLFSGKNISMMADFELDAACAVTTVIMGYNVRYEVSLASEAAKQVKDLYTKASSGGGSVSFFGIPIGIGASHSEGSSSAYNLSQNGSDFTKFTIAGEDSGYPTVLGVIGRKLPRVTATSHS